VLNNKLGMNGGSDFGWKTGLLSEHFYKNQLKCPVDVWWWVAQPFYRTLRSVCSVCARQLPHTTNSTHE
jgi:hypothetical protein